MRSVVVKEVQNPIYNDLVMMFDVQDVATRDDVVKRAQTSLWNLFKHRKAQGFNHPVPLQFIMLDPVTGHLHRITSCVANAQK